MGAPVEVVAMALMNCVPLALGCRLGEVYQVAPPLREPATMVLPSSSVPAAATRPSPDRVTAHQSEDVATGAQVAPPSVERRR